MLLLPVSALLENIPPFQKRVIGGKYHSKMGLDFFFEKMGIFIATAAAKFKNWKKTLIQGGPCGGNDHKFSAEG